MTKIDYGLVQDCLCGDFPATHLIANGIPVLVCDSCSIIRQYLTMSKDQYYNFYQDGYHTGGHKGVQLRTYEEEVTTAEKRIDTYSSILSDKILDIGCGLGGFVDTTRRLNFDCWGQEITEHSKESVTYRGELESINFPTDYFQTITIHDVLEHIIKPKEFLQEVFRITSQEGYTIIDIPNFFVEEGIKHWKITEHLWMLNGEQLSALFKDIGFLIEKLEIPIPGKLVFYLKKPIQNRTKILLPPGIGDIYWVVTKLESFIKKNNLGIPDMHIQEQGDRNRGLSYVEKFPFLNAKSYGAPLSGNIPEFAEAYKRDKRSIFKDILGCDYFIAFNGSMRHGRKLSEIHSEYEVNWYPRMFRDKEELTFGESARQKYGDYIVGYFSDYKMYQRWLDEFSIASIAKAFEQIHAQTGYKVLLVGSAWDLEGIGKAVKAAAPDICIDLVNQTSLTQLFGLFRCSKGVIGFPSGITIMSVAMKIKTVMIWNSYFQKSFWQYSVAEDSWNAWYKALDSKGLTSEVLTKTFLGM